MLHVFDHHLLRVLITNNRIDSLLQTINFQSFKKPVNDSMFVSFMTIANIIKNVYPQSWQF
jgi:hypothetical protein